MKFWFPGPKPNTLAILRIALDPKVHHFELRCLDSRATRELPIPIPGPSVTTEACADYSLSKAPSCSGVLGPRFTLKSAGQDGLLEEGLPFSHLHKGAFGVSCGSAGTPVIPSLVGPPSGPTLVQVHPSMSLLFHLRVGGGSGKFKSLFRGPSPSREGGCHSLSASSRLECPSVP